MPNVVGLTARPSRLRASRLPGRPGHHGRCKVVARPVIEQDPTRRLRRPRSQVDFVLSLGKPEVSPSSSARCARTARAAMLAQDLKVRFQEEVRRAALPGPQTQPPAGTSVEEGTKIIVFSDGPEKIPGVG